MKGLPEFKRIVTGHDNQGQAIVSSCDQAPNCFPIKAVPGMNFYEIWNTASIPALLDNSEDPTSQQLKLSPTPQGSVIRVVDFPPDAVQNKVSTEDVAATLAQIGELHAADRRADSKHQLMHRTETLDYGIVMEGELWLIVDQGEIHLKRGDIIVQRGTNHAWSNRTDSMARMIFILLDGHYTPDIREALQ